MAEQQAPAGQFLDVQQKYVFELLNQVNTLREQNAKLINLCHHQKNVVTGLENEKVELLTKIEGLNHQLLAATKQRTLLEPERTTTEIESLTKPEQSEPEQSEPEQSEPEQSEPEVIMDIPTGNEVIKEPQFEKTTNTNDIVNALYSNKTPLSAPNIPSDKSEMATRTMPSFDGSIANMDSKPPNLGDL